MRHAQRLSRALRIGPGDGLYHHERDAFVFVSRNRKQARVLWYDGTGMRLLTQKRFSGRFTTLWTPQDGGEVELTMSE